MAQGTAKSITRAIRFGHLRRLLEVRLKKQGRREYIQVLRLLETFALDEVSGAVEDALRMNTISFDAVRHLVLCRIEADRRDWTFRTGRIFLCPGYEPTRLRIT